MAFNPELAGVIDAVAPMPEDPAELLIPKVDYARHPLPDAFENLDEVLVPLFRAAGPDAELDVTVFYSELKDLTEEGERDMLAHNEAAFAAARGVGGLLIYYQGARLPAGIKGGRSPKLDIGVKNPDCFSFCAWEKREQAAAASTTEEHKGAVYRAMRWYETFDIVKYAARVESVRTPSGLIERVAFEPSTRVL